MKKSSARLLTVVLILFCGCSKKNSGQNPRLQSEVESSAELVPVNRPVNPPSEKSNNFLHTVFSVSKYAQYSFEVPAHHGHARLHGEFRSFTKRDQPESTSDSASNVDVMLLNEQEFNEYQHGEMQSAVYELDPAHNQTVDWGVPPTYEEPQRYHLVFSNSDTRTGIKYVRADFTVSPE
jgi:hypothetical protein